MNVLLVCPKPKISTRTDSAPLGILSIATYLKAKGHTVKFIDKRIAKYDVDEIVREFNPGIVGVAVISTKAISDALSICDITKKYGVPIIWGGTFSSLIPDLILNSGKVDYVAIGEGEITMLELIDSINGNRLIHDVDGLAYVENGEIVYNKGRSFADLADFPPIDWSIVDPKKYFRAYFGCEKMIYLYGSKGCPGQCTFCMNKQYHRRTLRKRPLAHVIEEIKYLVENCGLDGVYFSDENCCGSKSEMRDFCDSIKSTGLNFVWGCQTRINGFHQEDFQYMYDAGCRWIYFGVESGSKEMLVKIKKGIDPDKILETVSNCYKAGIVAISGFIIGFPGETENELQQTIELAKAMPFAMWAFHHFVPFHGTELYASLVAQEKISISSTLNEMVKISIWDKVIKNFSNIPTKELNVVWAYFMVSTLTRKKPNQTEKPFSFGIKVFKEQLFDMAKGGFLSFFANFALTAKTFLTYIYYFFFFPKIRKKYGLYPNKTESE